MTPVFLRRQNPVYGVCAVNDGQTGGRNCSPGNRATPAPVVFADNGQGVPEEQLPYLFDQFWRGDQARSSRGGEGSGLGLYIARHIVEAHGGTITAKNDRGLVFEIALPCEEVSGDGQDSDCRRRQ